MPKTTAIQYMCSYCGRKEMKSPVAGRPEPGNCPRRPRTSGGYWPHRWVINKRFYDD